MPVIHQKPTVESQSKKGATGAKKKKAGRNRKADQKNSLSRKALQLRRDEIKVVPMHIVAAMVFGDPKYNN